MPNAIASAGPLTVTVRATLVGCLWNFGDGSGFDSGSDLGRAYPAESSVQHLYDTDSSALPNGYTVSASIYYRVDYSVNGGPWTELGLKSRPFQRQYIVEQLQPEGVETN
jgi:hypothetical protein